MKKRIFILSLLSSFMLLWAATWAAESSLKNLDGMPLSELMAGIRLTPLTGEMTAPDFSLMDLSGKEL